MNNNYQGVQTSTCVWNVTNFRTYQRNNDNRRYKPGAVDPHRWLRAVRCGWVKKKEMYKVRSRKAISTSSIAISLAIPLT